MWGIFSKYAGNAKTITIRWLIGGGLFVGRSRSFRRRIRIPWNHLGAKTCDFVNYDGTGDTTAPKWFSERRSPATSKRLDAKASPHPHRSK